MKIECFICEKKDDDFVLVHMPVTASYKGDNMVWGHAEKDKAVCFDCLTIELENLDTIEEEEDD